MTTPDSKDGPETVLGLDLGTSAVKVVAVGTDAKVIATGAAPFPTFSDVPDQAEQDPADWLRAVGRAVADLDGELGPRRPDWRAWVKGVGVTAQLPTLVCMGAGGSLGPAITWKDARADGPTAALLDSASRRALYEQTGMPLDGRYLGPMFRHHWLGRRAEVESVLSAKDYLVRELTGQRVTDPSTAAGYGAFDLQSGAFSEALCALWGFPTDSLPMIRPAHSAAPLSAVGAHLLGVPVGIAVCVGAADSVSSAYAMAGLEEGIACITMGSSTVIIDAVREARLDPAARYLLTPHVEPGWYGREMDLLATGTGYRWLSDLLGLPDGVLDQRAAEAPPGARGLIFTPYLAGGEQGALWDPTLRGSMSGLTLQHTSSDIARAFLEGVGFEIRRCLGVLSETTPVREVVIAGHMTGHASSLQILADILNQPIQPYPAGSPAALGAALGALQRVTSQPQSPRVGPTWPRRVNPSQNAQAYHSLYASYLARTKAQRSSDATPVV